MSTSFFSLKHPTAETLRKDVRNLADDTLEVVRRQVLDPTLDVARRAREQARGVVQQTRGHLSQQVSAAEHFATDQYDQTARWVLAHPLKSIGVAFAIGLVISGLFGRASK